MNIFQESYFYKGLMNSSPEELSNILQDKSSQYTEIQIPKSDGYRIINCIDRASELYKIQKDLNENFFNRIPLPDSVYGFVEGGSYKKFLLPHIKKENETQKVYYMRIDIKAFFESVKIDLLSEVFSYYFKIDDVIKNKLLLDSLIEIITLKGSLPQGAVTSPSVSNIVFRQLDLRILKYCRKLNINYSRYADDMLFSSTNKILHKESFFKKIDFILRSKNFRINYKKTKKGLDEIHLGGFIVGTSIRLSRRKKSDISKALFLFEKGGQPKTTKEYIDRLNANTFINRKQNFIYKSHVINYLGGYRSFLLDWTEKSNELGADSPNYSLVKRLEKVIIKLDELK